MDFKELYEVTIQSYDRMRKSLTDNQWEDLKRLSMKNPLRFRQGGRADPEMILREAILDIINSDLAAGEPTLGGKLFEVLKAKMSDDQSGHHGAGSSISRGRTRNLWEKRTHKTSAIKSYTVNPQSGAADIGKDYLTQIRALAERDPWLEPIINSLPEAAKLAALDYAAQYILNNFIKDYQAISEAKSALKNACKANDINAIKLINSINMTIDKSLGLGKDNSRGPQF